MEEALKCEAIAAVIAETPELSFTASGRLLLAVEQSHVTGYLLRYNPRSLSTTACITRWKIIAAQSELTDAMPGVGFSPLERRIIESKKWQTWHMENRICCRPVQTNFQDHCNTTGMPKENRMICKSALCPYGSVL